jgi:hypothetical protein
VSLVHRGSPEWTPNYRAWNRDLTPPETRVRMWGLAPDRVPPGERLALWPGESGRMRRERHPPVDFADTGYLLVTAWTRQRTMRQLVTPNDVLFYQSIELGPAVLCDSDTVRFLQLRYLLVAPGIDCEPWRVLPDLRVDGRLEVRVAVTSDRRARALPDVKLTEPWFQAPALSSDSRLIRSLIPLAGTAVHLGVQAVTVQLGDPSAAAGHALVLPVAYDPAWRSSNGQTIPIGGLLGVTDISQPRVTVEFVPDPVAWLRALSTTLAQLLAAAGLIGLAFARPLRIRDTAVAALEQRVLTRARLEFGRLDAQTRGYLLYAAAVMLSLRWTPRDADETGLGTALLVPLTALIVVRVSRSRWWHRGIGASLLALVFFRTIAAGSLSPDALRDPPFWAVMTVMAIGLLAVGRRARVAAASTAAIAGACAMTATLVVMLPAPLSGLRESLAALSSQIGIVALVALLGVWVHAIAFGSGRGMSNGATGMMARGALLVALLFTLTGVVLTRDGLDAAWLLALGSLLGLAGARPTAPADRTDDRAMMRAAGIP